MAGDYDATDWDLVVSAKGDDAGDRIISGFAGLSNYQPAQTGSPIQAPGGKRIGFNLQRGANGVDFSVMVFQNSQDVKYLRDLARRQVRVGVKAVLARNLDSYAIDELSALGCETGILNIQADSVGAEDEAGTLEFQVTGIGPIEEYITS